MQFSANNSEQAIARYNEKKQLRKAGNALGTGFFLTAVIAYFFVFAVIIITGFFGVSRTTIISLLEDDYFVQLFQALFSVIGFIFPFLLATKMQRLRISDIIEFKKPVKGTVVPLLLIGFGVCCFANIAAALFSSVLKNIGIGNYEPDFQMPGGITGILLSLISVAAVPAMVEEFAVRGVFLGSVKKYGEGFAIITSSIFFGLMHGNLSQIPFAFIVGFALAFIAVKTQSILPAILLHLINNSLSVLLNFVTKGFSGTALTAVNVLYFSLGAAAMAIGFVFIKQKSSDLFMLKQADGALSGKEKMSAFLTSPMIIVVYITTILQIAASEFLL